jgi:hypothetical protein
MPLPTQLQVFANFYPPKWYNIYSPDISPPHYFLFPRLKMKLKLLHFADVAEIQGAVTDELKKGPEGGNFVSFSENVRQSKSQYIWQWSLFRKKNRYVTSSCVFDFYKNQS